MGRSPRGARRTPVDVLDRIELAGLATLLASHCDALLPPRMAAWVRRHGLHRFRDLVLEDPMKLQARRDVGRRAVVATDEILRRHTSLSWRALRNLLLAEARRAHEALKPDTEVHAMWDTFAAAVPATFRELPLRRVDLPARMHTHCEDLKLETLADLLACRESELLTRAHLGRASLRDTVATLRRLFASLSRGSTHEIAAAESSASPSAMNMLLDRALAPHGNWLALLRARLGKLPPNRRLAFARRAGLDGTPVTLAGLGELLHVSRERARQVELRALDQLGRHWWPLPFRERLLVALGDGARDLESLAGEPFFKLADRHAHAFDYVLLHMLDGVARVVQIAGRAVVARTSQAALDEEMAILRRVLRQLAFPIPELDVVRVVERHIGGSSPSLVPFVIEEVRGELAIADAPEGRVVTGHAGLARIPRAERRG